MLCILVIWPVLMAVTGFTTYIAVVYSVPINVASNFSYMSAILVTCVNIAGSKLVTKTTEMEGWTSRTQIKVGPRCNNFGTSYLGKGNTSDQKKGVSISISTINDV